MIRTVPGGNVGPAGGGGTDGDVGDGAPSSSPERPRPSADDRPPRAQQARPADDPPAPDGRPGAAPTAGSGAPRGEDRRRWTATPGPAGVATSDQPRRSTSARGPVRRRGRGTSPAAGPAAAGSVTATPRTAAGVPPPRHAEGSRELSDPDPRRSWRGRGRRLRLRRGRARLLIGPRRTPPSSPPSSTGGWPGSPSSTCSAGRSSAGCGSPSTRGCSCRAAARGPRPRRRSSAPGPVPVVVDLCCGSGALGRGGRRRPGSPCTRPTSIRRPCACARRNLGAGAAVHQGDLFDGTPAPGCAAGRRAGGQRALRAHVGIALMPPEARDHEPGVALDGGEDGLAVLRRLVAGAPAWLAPGGSLLFETGTAQVADAVAVRRGARPAGRRGRRAARPSSSGPADYDRGRRCPTTTAGRGRRRALREPGRPRPSTDLV